VTKYGDELALLRTQEQITAPALRKRLQWVWNGSVAQQFFRWLGRCGMCAGPASY
jgi:hypothetical protein